MSEATPDQLDERILLWPELYRLVQLSRVSIWALRRAGKFPAPIKLSANRIGWRLSEVRAWIATRERA